MVNGKFSITVNTFPSFDCFPCNFYKYTYILIYLHNIQYMPQSSYKLIHKMNLFRIIHLSKKKIILLYNI